MFTTIAAIIAIGYLGISILSILYLAVIPNYEASHHLEDMRGYSSLNPLSLLFYASVAILAIQYPGMTAWVLIGLIVAPFVISAVRGDRSDYIEQVGPTIAWSIVYAVAQAICVLIMVL